MMNKSLLYISDTGLVLLLVVYLPLCLIALWLIGRLLRSLGCSLKARRWVRWPLALAMLLWPTWDAILGKYYLDRYCEKGGVYAEPGIRIDGIYFPFEGSDRLAEAYLGMGFKYIEAESGDGSKIHYEMGGNGELHRKIVKVLESEYISKSGNPNMRVKPDFLEITIQHHYLMNIENKNIVAGFKNYRFQSRLDGRFTVLDVFPSISCNDLSQYKTQERYQKPSSYYSLIMGQEG